MAPKGKPKAKAIADSTAASATESKPDPVYARQMADMQNDIEVIKAHPIFQDIDDAAPVPLKRSST